MKHTFMRSDDIFVGFRVTASDVADTGGEENLIIRSDGADAYAGKSYLIGSSGLAAADSSAVTFDLGNIEAQTGSYQFIRREPFDWSRDSVALGQNVDSDGKDDLINRDFEADSDGGDGSERLYPIREADLAAPDTGDEVSDRAIDRAIMNAQSESYQFIGAASGDYSGSSVASAGDVDGDGKDDLIIGAPGADDKGNSYLIMAASLAAADAADGERTG